MINAARNFKNILFSINLDALYSYFDSPLKLFLNLAKFLLQQNRSFRVELTSV